MSSLAARGEHGRALLQERAHAFGIIRREARFALHLALEIELRVEVVVPGFVKRAFGEREAHGRCRGEMAAELVGFIKQDVVCEGLPDEPPCFGRLGRQRLSGERQSPRSGGPDQPWQEPGAAKRAAKTMSQAKAMLAPAPAAMPFTAATTGKGRARSLRTSGL